VAKYNYEIEGTDVNGRTWKAIGSIPPCDMMSIFDHAMQAAFAQLTQGKAVYGHPGVGCRGPYHITRVVLQDADTKTLQERIIDAVERAKSAKLATHNANSDYQFGYGDAKRDVLIEVNRVFLAGQVP
jgi:hypothetical protein